MLTRRRQPPDIFPQVEGQEEDSLSESNVRKGFQSSMIVSNECFSAKDLMNGVSISRMMGCFSNILNHKHRTGTLVASNRKKPVVNTKDCFWLVTGKSKNLASQWLRELCCCRQLRLLSKKIPIFHKKEELFHGLCEHQVPMSRAVWLIKMTNAYNVTISETKSKRKSTVDPSTEWMQGLCKFIFDMLSKLTDPCVKVCQELLVYLWRLCIYMYGDGLLDRHQFLLWLVQSFIKLKADDNIIANHILPIVYKFRNDFCESEQASRALLTLLADRARYLLGASKSSHVSCGQPPDRLVTILEEFKSMVTSLDVDSCKFHTVYGQTVVMLIQHLVIRCPPSAVWSSSYETTFEEIPVEPEPHILGSPLDLLQLSPSELSTEILSKEHTLKQLKEVEEEIITRSTRLEDRWCYGIVGATTVVERLLTMLVSLDKMDPLRQNRVSFVSDIALIVSGVIGETLDPCLLLPSSMIKVLCDWAVTTHRNGIYRPYVVAAVLNKVNTDLLMNSTQMMEESGSGRPFQSLLWNYLEDLFNSVGSTDARLKLDPKNLLILFAELCRSNTFSYEAYINSLISRCINVGPIEAAVGVNCSTSAERGMPGHRLLLLNLPVSKLPPHLYNQRAVLLNGSTRATEQGKENLSELLQCGLDMLAMTERNQLTDKELDNLRLLAEDMLLRISNLSGLDCGIVLYRLTKHLDTVLRERDGGRSGGCMLFPALYVFIRLFLRANQAKRMVEYLIRWLPSYRGPAVKVSMPSHVSSDCVMLILSVICEYIQLVALSQDLMVLLFKNLLVMIERVSDYFCCSMAEHAILGVLREIHSCSIVIKEKFPSFSNVASTVQDSFVSSDIPLVVCPWDAGFLLGYIQNPATTVWSEIWTQTKSQWTTIDRKNLVNNILLHVAPCRDPNKILLLGWMFAEVSCRIKLISSEMMQEVTKLCENRLPSYSPLFSLELSSSGSCESIALFLTWLLTWQILNLNEFFNLIAFPLLETALLTISYTGERNGGLRIVLQTLTLLFDENRDVASLMESARDLSQKYLLFRGSCALLRHTILIDVLQKVIQLIHDLADRQNSPVSVLAKATLKSFSQQSWIRGALSAEVQQHNSAMLPNINMRCLQNYSVTKTFFLENLGALVERGDELALMIALLRQLTVWNMGFVASELADIVFRPGGEVSQLDNVATAVVRAAELTHESGATAERYELCTGLLCYCVRLLPVSVADRVIDVLTLLQNENRWWLKRPGMDGSRLHTTDLYSLLMENMRTFDGRRYSLLNSLCKQVSAFTALPYTERYNLIRDPGTRTHVVVSLLRKLSQLGNQLVHILSTPGDWPTILVQLAVHCGLSLSLSMDREVFLCCSDMLMLMLQTASYQNGTHGPEHNYMAMVRRIRKEIGQEKSEAAQLLTQLLPVNTPLMEIPVSADATSEPVSQPTLTGINGSSLVQSSTRTETLSISSWDLVEDHRPTPGYPLNLLGAVRIDKRTAAYDNAKQRLKHHTHQWLDLDAAQHEDLAPPPSVRAGRPSPAQQCSGPQTPGGSGLGSCSPAPSLKRPLGVLDHPQAAGNPPKKLKPTTKSEAGPLIIPQGRVPLSTSTGLVHLSRPTLVPHDNPTSTAMVAGGGVIPGPATSGGISCASSFVTMRLQTTDNPTRVWTQAPSVSQGQLIDPHWISRPGLGTPAVTSTPSALRVLPVTATKQNIVRGFHAPTSGSVPRAPPFGHQQFKRGPP